MMDILDSFWGAIGILMGAALIYVLFRLAHPYSEKARDVIEAHLAGCFADAGIWFIIVLIASQLATRNSLLWYAFMQILDTSFFNVQFVTWSMLLVPLSFSIHKAYGRYDYRGLAIAGLCIIALGLGVYYWNILSSLV
jgi:hypothetical protein